MHREFQNGTVVYNPMGNKAVPVALQHVHIRRVRLVLILLDGFDQPASGTITAAET